MGPGRQLGKPLKSEKRRFQNAVFVCIVLKIEFHMLFMDVGPNFHGFWEAKRSEIRTPNPDDVFKPLYVRNQRTDSKNIEASNTEILRIIAQAQCFSVFTFSNVLFRCGQAAPNIHQKNIRQIIENHLNIC